MLDAKELIAAGDSRVLKLIDRRVEEFGNTMLLSLLAETYNLKSPEVRVLAKKWLARPFWNVPYRPEKSTDGKHGYWEDDVEVEWHFWCCMYLLKGNAEEQQLGVDEMRKLFDEIGIDTIVIPKDGSTGGVYNLGTNLQFKLNELLKLNRKDVRQLCCRLGNLANPPWSQTTSLKLLFNAGCLEALKSITKSLRATQSQAMVSSSMKTPDGQLIQESITESDCFVQLLLGQKWWDANGYRLFAYPDWAPPDFKYSAKEPNEVKTKKREQLAEWLEKKFLDVKQGKCPPLPVEHGP